MYTSVEVSVGSDHFTPSAKHVNGSFVPFRFEHRFTDSFLQEMELAALVRTTELAVLYNLRKITAIVSRSDVLASALCHLYYSVGVPRRQHSQ